MEKPILQPRFKDSPHFKNFWEIGNGKSLIEFSGAAVSFKDFDKFSHFFYDVDETGDNVIKDIYFTQTFPEASKQIETCIRNGISAKDEIPESVKILFGQTQTVPDWLDYELIRSGAELCIRCNVDSLIFLRDEKLITREARIKKGNKDQMKVLSDYLNITKKFKFSLNFD